MVPKHWLVRARGGLGSGYDLQAHSANRSYSSRMDHGGEAKFLDYKT